MSGSVLVTGATGLLGRTVALRLSARGDTVTVMQRGDSGLPLRQVRGDLGDADARMRALEGVDRVIHCAAKVSINGPASEFRAINVDGTSALLASARRQGVHSFVHVSTPSVAHVGRAIHGAQAETADPSGARGEYARTKAEAELLALAASESSFSVCAIRPHLVWGPGDEQLIGRIVARAAAGRLFLIDHGYALIDTTYIDNAADALIAALDTCAENAGRAFVISNGEPRTVAEMLDRICSAAGQPSPVRSVPARLAYRAGLVAERVWGESEPPLTSFLVEQLSTAHWFDQRQARAALHWVPTVSIEQGFRRLGEYYGTLVAPPSTATSVPET
ncbi:MAG: NAD-dependent epimerase/dehydratase family protein [Candidatus Nanopelagicales bacterium]